LAAPRGVLWSAEPHTLVKHAVYKHYLRRWLPIMVQGKWKSEATYAEGFSGPGTYTGGEDGSPVIALRTLILDPVLRTRCKAIRFLFVERDPGRALRLRQELARVSAPVALEELSEHGIDLEVRQGDCDPELMRMLSQHHAWGRPMLVVLDTWGGAVDLAIVRRIAHNRSGEVIITFQPQFFTRFADDKEIVHGDTVFGTDDWRRVSELASDKKNAWVIAAYRKTLHLAGFKYVLTFELVDRRGASLFLVFGTNHERGLEKMKEAMWEVDEVSGVRYRDPADPLQGLLDIAVEPELDPLARILCSYLEKQPDLSAGVNELRAFALYESVYKASQVKPALERLVQTGKVDTDDPNGAVRLESRVTLIVTPLRPTTRV
jgi:three-Cys-motif partner protein